MSSQLDSLLDMTLDDLADLPSFRPFHPGAHELLLTLEPKEVANKPCVEASFKLVATLELSEPLPEGEEENKEGDTASCLFFLDNEVGQGKFKALAAVLGEALDTGSLAEIVEQTTDMAITAVTGIQVDKKDATKKYLNLLEVAVS